MPDSNQLYDEADRLKTEGKLEEAVAKYQEILDQDADYALAHAALAVALGRLGRHEDAIKHARQVCELEPNDAFSHTQLSVIYQRAYAGTNNPQYIQDAEDAKPVGYYSIPAGAHVMVKPSQIIRPGMVLAKTPHDARRDVAQGRV